MNKFKFLFFMDKTTIIVLIIVLAIVVGAWWMLSQGGTEQPTDEPNGMDNGNEEPPEEEPNGEEQETFEVNNNLKLSNIQPDKVVQSPLLVKGEARGSWYFEGSFSVILENGNGEEISSAQAEAQGEWTTEEFVPFEAELSFEEPETNTGTLILEKANPSGMPDKDVSEEIPVKFK